MNDAILSNPYVILADNTFWTGRHSFEGDWSDEYPDAWKFTDEGTAGTVADMLAARYPDQTVTVWQDYGDATEREIYQATPHPHNHSWRLIQFSGSLAITAAVPMIDESGKHPVTRMVRGRRYRCSCCDAETYIPRPHEVTP